MAATAAATTPPRYRRQLRSTVGLTVIAVRAIIGSAIAIDGFCVEATAADTSAHHGCSTISVIATVSSENVNTSVWALSIHQMTGLRKISSSAGQSRLPEATHRAPSSNPILRRVNAW